MDLKYGWKAKCVVMVLMAFIASSPLPAYAADQWTGIDGSVDNVNNLMALATTAVQEGNYESAKTQLAATARNLEAASSWAHFVWVERQTNPSYVPSALNPLPPELTATYYTDNMTATKASYDQLLVDIQQAQIQLGLKKFSTLVSILTGAVNLSKGIVDTVKDNPLMLPKNLLDLQAQVETDAADIQANFSALESAGLLLKRLTRFKDNVVALFRELRETRQGIMILVPEVKRIETAMPMALASIQRGRDMPLPVEQQTAFDAAPFTTDLTTVETGLDEAELPWESGLPMIDDIYAQAQAVYNAIAAPTQSDTDAWNSFDSWYTTWETDLTSPRDEHIQQLTALGNDWRQALISVLTQYMDISFGTPVPLADCSAHDPIDPALALTWTDPRAWKTDYQTTLSAPTGPDIVPAQAGSLENDWHEYAVNYPSRLSGLLDTYSQAWQSAYASMSYEDWESLYYSTDTRQPYQIFVLKRESLDTLLENLNVIRSEAIRFAGAVSDVEDAVSALNGDLSVLQAKADAYRQFFTAHAATVPEAEFDEYITVTETDVPGISRRMLLAADGISVLETEAVIEYLEREMTQFAFEADEAGESATGIGNQADVIVFDINRMLAFNDSIASKEAAALEMLDYKFDYDKDVFLGNGDYGYLFDSLETLDNDLWRNVDTWYYHDNPPDIQTQIVPHVNYIESCGSIALNRFAWLTEQIWSVTDNLTFAEHEDRPDFYAAVGTGYNAGSSYIILPENQTLVDEFTSVRFLRYHMRPYTDPMGYITLDQIRLGLPNVKAWLSARTGGGYTDLAIEKTSDAIYYVPVDRKLQVPLTIRVIDAAGNPVSGVPVTLNYDADALHGEGLQSTDSDGLASFYPGPYAEAGSQTVTFSVASAFALSISIEVVADTDGDGCGDDWESAWGFNPAEAFDGEGDFDADGLTNVQEQALGTNPLQADTDGDGFTDIQEMDAGSDPADAEDVPQTDVPEFPTPLVMKLGADWEKASDDIGDTAQTDDWYVFTNAVSFKGRIWAFGRYDYTDTAGTGHYVNEIWSSPDGIRWTKVSDSPEWAPRNAFAVAVHNDRLWLVGGNFEDTLNTGAGTTYYSDVWASDDGICWSRVDADAEFGPRYNAHVLSMGGSLWLIGGYLYDTRNEVYGDRNDVWTSTDGVHWTQVTASAPWPLRRSAGFSSTVFDNTLWIMGGDWSQYDTQTGQSTWTTFQDVWNSADGVNWTQVTDTPAWPARYGAGLVALNGRLWLLGGYSHIDEFMSFEVWTSEDGTSWHAVDAPGEVRGMAFGFGNDLWSLTHVQGTSTGVINHRLWRSRGPAKSAIRNPIPVHANPTSFSAGAAHVLAISGSGTLWAWGENHAGQLGDGTTEARSKPVQIGTDTDWQAVAAGMYFSMAIKTDGSLWAWGQNDYGQVGNSTATDQYTPVRIGTDTDWAVIAAGQNHALAIKTDGSLWAWGLNNGGQIGDGTKENRTAPVRIGTDIDWMLISAGSSHSTAVKQDGSVWIWGNNYSGQLGTTTATEFLVPSQGSQWEWSNLTSGNISICAGSSFTAALRSDGLLNLWGGNSNGQIGTGSTSSKYLNPVSITPFDAWLAVSAGDSHTAAIKLGNTLWAWGSISSFHPADITYAPGNLPVPVSPDTDWTAVSSGSNFSVAQKADGSLWAWGGNGYGQLGNGTTVSLSTPSRVLALGPTANDTDGDWMDDAWEIEYFGDTSRNGEADYDADGLTDFLEFQIGTLPDNTDSDRDGMPDKWETDMGLNPTVDDARQDADGDGLTNLEEYQVVVGRYTTGGQISAMAASGNFLYVIDEQAVALNIIDTSNPAAPVVTGTYSGGFQWCYGLKLDSGATACVANGDAVFHLIDVTNPAAPQSLGTYASGEGYIQGFDISGAMLCFADSTGNLQVIDISDPASPVYQSTYDNSGMGGLGEVIISGTRVYTTWSGSAIQIIDISDPASPYKAGEYTDDLAWPPSMAVSGDLLYAATIPGWADDGPSTLNIIDATDPAQLLKIGTYSGYLEGLALSGKLAGALIKDRIHLIDASVPAQPVQMADLDNISDSRISEIAISGDLLYARYGFEDDDSGIAIVDISKFTRKFITAEPGDINHSRTIDMADAVLALQVLTGIAPQEPVYVDGDVNNDQRIGIEEAAYAIRKAAGF